MKLYEIAKGKKSGKTGSSFEKVKIDSYNYGELELRVEYDWESPSSTRHGDNASFDEDHPGSIDITSVKLVKAFHDEDTEEKYPAGTEVSEMPGWKKMDDKEVEKQLDKLLGSDD